MLVTLLYISLVIVTNKYLVSKEEELKIKNPQELQ